MTQTLRAFRAAIVHFTEHPDASGRGLEYFSDGILLCENGRVKALGPAEQILAQGLDIASVEDFSGQVIMPGFIDSHVHCPQAAIIASYGEQLLDWLNNYTFPAELQFADAEFSAAASRQFLQLLLQHGTTTAMVYTSVFAHSTQAFFEQAQQLKLRMLAGKVMMDRHAPAGLLDTAASSERECTELIERWHNQDRLAYVLTPRFAPTSTPAQLAVTGKLLRRYPDVYLQTHLSESQAEIAWVKKLFPQAQDYLDVYDGYGLLGPRSIFGHGIHLSDREVKRLAETGSGVAFCPTSNLFLGSGLLDVQRLEQAGVSLSIATDVGAGTSFSLLRTLAEAYKVMQLQGQKLHPLMGFYRATLGNARALQLDSVIGNFLPGKEADFVVLDWAANDAQQLRQSRSQNINDYLFALMMLGDQPNVLRTYILAEQVFNRAQ